MSDEQEWPEGLTEGESIELGTEDYLQESAIDWASVADVGLEVTKQVVGGAAGGMAGAYAAQRFRRRETEPPAPSKQQGEPESQQIILPPGVDAD